MNYLRRQKWKEEEIEKNKEVADKWELKMQRRKSKEISKKDTLGKTRIINWALWEKVPEIPQVPIL